MAGLFLAAIFGLIGGLIRAAIGLLKKYRIDKKVNFRFFYLIITLVLSALIGLFISLAFSSNYLVNLVVGYAGIDFLENLVKIIKK